MALRRSDSTNSLASTISYSNVQAYIAVPKHLKDTILRDGYKCSKRDAVPVTLNQDGRKAVKAFRSHHAAEEHTVLLEVSGVPEEMIDRGNGKIKARELGPEHLSDGVVATRTSENYDVVPCPFCNSAIAGLSQLRGRVGEHHYFGDAVFMCSPCPNDACKKAQEERQQRLEGTETTKFHQTSVAVAQEIRQSGKMIRGGGGAAGKGIYLADGVDQTEWKTEHHGVVLRCEVKLGHVKELKQHDKNPVPCTFAELVQERYDSVKIDRGAVPNGPHKGQPSGDEYVVYSWDQVRVIEEIPRVRRTCECCKDKPDKP